MPRGRANLDLLDPPSSNRRADLLRRQIAALELKLVLIENQPDEPNEGDINVIWFQKDFGSGRTYTYAAVRAGSRWYLTGSTQATNSYTWGQLLEFIGDEEIWWGSEWARLQ